MTSKEDRNTANKSHAGAQVIISLQQKGGAGKTTMLCCLAGAMAKDGAHILFLDTEGGFPAAAWCEELGDENIDCMEITSEDQLPLTVEQYQDQYDAILIDTAGWDSRMASYAIGEADLILIPCKSSKKDSMQAITTYFHARTATKHHKQPPEIVISLWGLKTNTNVSERLSAEMSEAKMPILPYTMPALTGFEQMDWNGGMPQGPAGKAFRQWMGEMQTQHHLVYYDRPAIAHVTTEVA